MAVNSEKSKSYSKIAVVVGHAKRCPNKQIKSGSTLNFCEKKRLQYNSAYYFTDVPAKGTDNVISAAAAVKRVKCNMAKRSPFGLFAKALHPGCGNVSYKPCISCFFPAARLDLLYIAKEELIIKIRNSSILISCL